jgi:hypothetical protein
MSDLRDVKGLTSEEEQAISLGYHELARRAQNRDYSIQARLRHLGEWWGARAYRALIREQRERDCAKSGVRK